MEIYQCPQHEISYADGHKCPACERDAERARADALAARVEALGSALVQIRDSSFTSNLLAAMNIAGSALRSTPAADLSAHDARVKREALEAAWERLVACNHFCPETALDANECEAAVLGPEAQDNKQEGK